MRNIAGETESADSRVDLHGHGFQRGSGHPWFTAGLPITAAFLEKAAGVHEEDKGSFAAGREDSRSRLTGLAPILRDPLRRCWNLSILSPPYLIRALHA